MRHANLTLPSVWNHFLNMGGVIGELEVDAYLHGLMPLDPSDRICLAQAVNELLDDREMVGTPPCCRAPYDDGPLHDAERRACAGYEGPVTGTAERPAPRPSQRPPVRPAVRPEP